MYPLFETICINNGLIQNAEWHRMRYEKSYEIQFGKKPQEDLLHDINVPENFSSGIVKMKISYNEMSRTVTFETYTFKEIKTLKIVEDNTIDYSLKFTDRSRLGQLLEKRAGCDDILIVKNGFVTDTSFSNIIFHDGQEWITPSTPLLHGTARARLLASGMIKEEIIRITELNRFKSFKLINAMRLRDLEIILI